MKQSFAFITGASSGIGKVFAQKLSRKGYPLILTARREGRLKKLAEKLPTPVIIIEADLSKEEDRRTLAEKLSAYDIEILINNAGFGDCGDFSSTSLEKELAMIEVNIKAVHELTKWFLPAMEKKNRGYILNVASSAGLCPAGPYMATYYATKAYVASFTRAIAHELKEKGSRVYVGCLCPGPVNTEFNAVANVQFSLKGISPEYCVNTALKQMKKRKTVIVPSIVMKAATLFSRIMPPEQSIAMIAKQQKKKLYQKK